MTKNDGFDSQRAIDQANYGTSKLASSNKTFIQVIHEYLAFAQSNPIGRNGELIVDTTLKQYRTAVQRMVALGEREGHPILASKLCQKYWSEYYLMEAEFALLGVLNY